MEIYLELVIVFALMIIFIIWRIWFSFSRWRLKRKYNPEKDLAKLAEDKRQELLKHDENEKTRKGGGEQHREIGREQSNVIAASKSFVGSKQPKGRQLLQTTKADDNGKTSSSNRKNGSGIGRLLRRRRKK